MSASTVGVLTATGAGMASGIHRNYRTTHDDLDLEEGPGWAGGGHRRLREEDLQRFDEDLLLPPRVGEQGMGSTDLRAWPQEGRPDEPGMAPAGVFVPSAPQPRLATGNEDLVVLTPTRIRVDSRVVFTHCTSNWLSNCALAVLLLCKLQGYLDVSWWLIFAPSWLHHSISVPLQSCVIYLHKKLVQNHIGPPPPATATPGLSLRYDILRRVRTRSHIVDAVNAIIDTCSLCLVKLLICYQLANAPVVGGKTQVEWWSFRLIFLPFWLAWVATTGMTFFKDRQERIFGSARDLQYVFFLFVACKLDGRSEYSWRIVFLIPWLWFAAIFLLVFVVCLLLVLARVWRRLNDLILPVGFFALLVSCIPQFLSYLALVRMLDQIEADGSTTVAFEAVLVPNAASWFMMWSASIVLVIGLRQKEVLREGLLAAGQVWTAHEHLATQLAYETSEHVQRRVDLMSDEEVATIVEEMMRGKTKPSTLVRVGESLYHILTGAENDGMEVVATNPGDVEDCAGPTNASAQKPVPPAREAAAPPQTLQDELEMSTAPLRNPSPPSAGFLPNSPMDAAGPSNASDAGELNSEFDAQAVHPTPDDSLPPEAAAPPEAAGIVTGEPAAVPEPPQPRLSTMSDDCQCIICCDAPPTCVFLTCGHGGICRRCANLLFVRPPNECPTCRQKIEQLVELEHASTQVGDILRVKQ